MDEYGNVLYKFALLRVGDPHLAEDLLQETLLKAIDGYAGFRNESSVLTWLFAILRNEISRQYRSKKNQAVSTGDGLQSVNLDELLTANISGPQFSDAVEREEFWDTIQSCYQQLPEHLLETFLYRLANPQSSISDLCRELGIKESNLSVRLFRARLLLRRCVEKAWMDLG